MRNSKFSVDEVLFIFLEVKLNREVYTLILEYLDERLFFLDRLVVVVFFEEKFLDVIFLLGYLEEVSVAEAYRYEFNLYFLVLLVYLEYQYVLI